jgi:hypothetical protein
MSHTYGGPTAVPDPELAARNREFVRGQLRRDAPLYAEAVDSVVRADIPLEDAARSLREARNRVRITRNARTRSRAARLCGGAACSAGCRERPPAC